MSGPTLSRQVTPSPPPPVDRRVIFVVASLAIVFAGFGVTLALLKQRVTDLGFNDFAYGFSAGIFPVAAISGRLIAGRLIDSRGSRSTMVWGALITSAGSALFAAPGFVGLMAARSLQGFGDGLLYTAAAAAILDLVAADRRSQALGWLSGGIWGGLSLGAATGPLFGNLQIAGVVFAILGVGAVFFIRLLPAGIAVAPAQRSPGIRGLFPRAARRPGVVIGLTNFGYAAMTGFVVVLTADRFHGGNWALTAFGLTLLVVRGIFGFIPDRLAPRVALNSAHVILSIGLLIVALSPSLPLAILGAIVAACGHSIPWPVLVTNTLDRSDDNQRGAIIGAMTASFDIAVACAQVTFGIISQSVGTVWVFAAAIIAVAAGNVVSKQLPLPRELAANRTPIWPKKKSAVFSQDFSQGVDS